MLAAISQQVLRRLETSTYAGGDAVTVVCPDSADTTDAAIIWRFEWLEKKGFWYLTVTYTTNL